RRRRALDPTRPRPDRLRIPHPPAAHPPRRRHRCTSQHHHRRHLLRHRHRRHLPSHRPRRQQLWLRPRRLTHHQRLRLVPRNPTRRRHHDPLLPHENPPHGRRRPTRRPRRTHRTRRHLRQLLRPPPTLRGPPQ